MSLLSLSCTISQTLLIISQNLLRSRDHDHPTWGNICESEPTLHMANQCTKFKVTFLGDGAKNLKCHVTITIPLLGWHLIKPTCVKKIDNSRFSHSWYNWGPKNLQQAPLMQRDCTTHQKYEISHFKKLEIGNDLEGNSKSSKLLY